MEIAGDDPLGLSGAVGPAPGSGGAFGLYQGAEAFGHAFKAFPLVFELFRPFLTIF